MKETIVIAIILCCVIFLIIALSVYHSYREKLAADELYTYISDALRDYLTLHTPYISSYCYYKCEGIKYLLLQNQNDTLQADNFLTEKLNSIIMARPMKLLILN